MTPTRARFFAALVAALGLTAMSPAFAAGTQQSARPGADHRDGRMLEFHRGGAGIFQLAELSCAPRAADRLEARLERVGGRLDLTAAQQRLFEDFRTAALTAQTGLADDCTTLRPGGSVDLVQRLEQRLKLDEARLAAMTDLLPQFKALYESLTDKQKAGLMPMRPDLAHPGRPAQSGGL